MGILLPEQRCLTSSYRFSLRSLADLDLLLYFIFSFRDIVSYDQHASLDTMYDALFESYL